MGNAVPDIGKMVSDIGITVSDMEKAVPDVGQMVSGIGKTVSDMGNPVRKTANLAELKDLGQKPPVWAENAKSGDSQLASGLKGSVRSVETAELS